MDSVALPAIVMTVVREEIGSEVLEGGISPIHSSWERIGDSILKILAFFDLKSSNSS